MLLMCWSLTVSFENLTGAGVFTLGKDEAATGAGFGVVVALEDADLAAMLESID